MSVFSKMLSQGRKTEIKIAKWFESKGFTVEDVSGQEYYQQRDIDFIVYDKNNKARTVEVKSDEVQHKTQNLFIEHGMERECGWCDGWFHYCEADILCYHDNVKNVGQLYDWPKTKQGLIDLMAGETDACREIKFYNKADCCYGWAWIIPLSEVRKLGWILLEYDLNKC